MATKKPFSLLFLLIFFSLSILPIFSSSLSTFSISETSNQTLICALILSQNRDTYLNCTSLNPSGIQIPVSSPNASIFAITAGNGFVCVLRSTSLSTQALACWRFSGNGNDLIYKRIYYGPILDQLDAGNDHICGRVNWTNQLICWQWREFNSSIGETLSGITVGGEFLCGLSEFGEIKCFGNDTGIIDSEPAGNYTTVAAGFRHACAISVDGRLECWGQMEGNKPLGIGLFTSLALGNNRSCALRSNGTVVCWGEDGFDLPERLRETEFVSIKAKNSVFCGIVARNYSLFCWGNEFFQSTNFLVFERVMPGSCTSTVTGCPCKPLPDSDTLCNGGVICPPCERETYSDESPPASPSPSPTETSKKENWTKERITFLAVGCVGAVSLVASSCFFLHRFCNIKGCRVHDSGRLDEAAATASPTENGPSRRDQQVLPSVEKRLSQLASMGHSGHLEEFTLQTLLQLTGNFSEEYKIGSGSFGSVYRGTLDDGRDVAIKRAELSCSSSYAGATKRQDDNDNAFVSELALLSRLNHKNLVRLFGYCEDVNERVLVYEFMSNGSLHDHLHNQLDGGSPLMSWSTRLKLALDAARGIEYLHYYAVPPIIHRDIKSSNILLDAAWTAKVSDFGLSLMGPEDDESHLSLGAAGTVGYLDPEYYRFQQLTPKSDVYSFGVVLLELLSGYKAIHRNENGVPRNVVDFVVPYIFGDEIHRVLDQKLPPPTPFEIEAVQYVGYIAADCVTLEGRNRPSMTEIVNILERGLAACLAPPTLSRSTTESST